MAYKRIFSGVAFLLAFVSVGWGGQDCKMIATVLDPAGGVVPNAYVVVYAWNQAPASGFALQEVGRFVTGNSGEFHASFETGTYEILSAYRGLLPTAARVTLTPGSTTRVSLQLRLDPSQPIEACCDARVPTE
jgi:hypothetical protein